METSVMRAHDELLAAQPPGARHDVATCAVCSLRETTTKEVANVPEDKRTFTEAEHEALLTDAVRREVATATESKDDEIAGLRTQIDTLESEKAALEQAKADAENQFEEFKQGLDRMAEIASRRDERISEIRRVSAHDLPDSYFTEERVNRWAEMADEEFAALVDSQAEMSLSLLAPEEASQLQGLEGEAHRAKLVEVIEKRRETADTTSTAPAERQTAAFTGGKVPTSPEKANEDQPSTLREWFGARKGTVPTA